MAPTISRHWRGGPEDYAALCDYCNVRYLRSQLTQQGSGRLACVGPGTNGCGAGRDEVELDKANADALRYRRKPSPHRGGRFDRLRASVEDIFAETLIEYWDASKGVVSAQSGQLTSWKGQRAGSTFAASPPYSKASWRESVPEFFGRPGIQVDGGPEVGSVWIAPGALVPSGARLYAAAALFYHSMASIYPGYNGAIELWGVSIIAGLARNYNAGVHQLFYRSVAVPDGTVLPLPVAGPRAQLFEMDARGPLTFRAGPNSEVKSSVDSPIAEPSSQVSLYPGSTVTLIVIAEDPTDAQISEFQSLGRSYAVMRP